ncbi:28S rRNA (cytosine-C(5))-methyltransferase-like 3 [Homarus americanus]|uniref:28S rRNA (Cytosine-C(5))-methyltransferase-like 3 n=1 Tax=Homarus americanus TaxID=6706 RepID=A0A8J5JKA7_HOMAM|nr:28S rRNA (cytosine-C(5))-methyltransferase-like 3 [Homarus americanus]
MTEEYVHSVPVPQLYKEASKILKSYEEKQGSLKTLVYNGKYRSYNRIYGLLCNTVQNSTMIKTALTEAKLFTEQPMFNPHLAQVLTAELLRKGFLSGDCKPIVILRTYEEKIKSFMDFNSNKETLQKKKDFSPRYVRVNTLVSSLDRVHAQLADEGWQLQEYDPTQVTYDDYLHLIQNMDETTYLIDYHIPQLLVFPPNTPFWNSILYNKNAIILQNKASCIPVFLSSVNPGANVIDACAAPGNKTSYISAIMCNSGSILAVEKDLKRFKTLQKLMVEREATCVTCINQNFNKLSCVNFHDDEVSEQRIRGLATFQKYLLINALSFPSVKEVIYSTCSVNVEENEENVEKALEHYQDEFELENLGQKLSGWKHFGDPRFVFGEKCLRTIADIDMCQGFFIAKFVRKDKKCGDTSNSVKKKTKKRKQNALYEASSKSDMMPKTPVDSDYGKEMTYTEQHSDDKKVKAVTIPLENPDTCIQSVETNYTSKKKRKLKQGNEREAPKNPDIRSKQESKDSVKPNESDGVGNVESNGTELVNCSDELDKLPPSKRRKAKKRESVENKNIDISDINRDDNSRKPGNYDNGSTELDDKTLCNSKRKGKDVKLKHKKDNDMTGNSDICLRDDKDCLKSASKKAKLVEEGSGVSEFIEIMGREEETRPLTQKKKHKKKKLNN